MFSPWQHRDIKDQWGICPGTFLPWSNSHTLVALQMWRTFPPRFHHTWHTWSNPYDKTYLLLSSLLLKPLSNRSSIFLCMKILVLLWHDVSMYYQCPWFCKTNDNSLKRVEATEYNLGVPKKVGLFGEKYLQSWIENEESPAECFIFMIYLCDHRLTVTSPTLLIYTDLTDPTE